MIRDIIFETVSGSHLYGTNRPDSDMDYMGVFMPTRDDVLGIYNGPQEMKLDNKISGGPRNTKDDVDRKLFALPKYLKLTADGQSQLLEMLFSPVSMHVTGSKIWNMIDQNKELFISQKSVMPFVGFATAQAHKSTLKAGNLIKLRNLIEVMDTKHNKTLLGEHVTKVNDNYYFDSVEINVETVTQVTGVELECLSIAGRKYEFTQNCKNVCDRLKELEARYGSRSNDAAAQGLDYKSLMHAYRLLYEAEDILREGKLILPFDKQRIKFLLSVRNAEYQTDFFQELEDKIKFIKTINSSLPKNPNYAKVNSLCTEIVFDHLRN
jgi:predicted nucleotidyltransferase